MVLNFSSSSQPLWGLGNIQPVSPQDGGTTSPLPTLTSTPQIPSIVTFTSTLLGEMAGEMAETEALIFSALAGNTSPSPQLTTAFLTKLLETFFKQREGELPLLLQTVSEGALKYSLYNNAPSESLRAAAFQKFQNATAKEGVPVPQGHAQSPGKPIAPTAQPGEGMPPNTSPAPYAPLAKHPLLAHARVVSHTSPGRSETLSKTTQTFASKIYSPTHHSRDPVIARPIIPHNPPSSSERYHKKQEQREKGREQQHQGKDQEGGRKNKKDQGIAKVARAQKNGSREGYRGPEDPIDTSSLTFHETPVLVPLSSRKVSQIDIIKIFLEILKMAIHSREEEKMSRRQEEELELAHLDKVVKNLKQQGDWLKFASIGAGIMGIVSGALPIVGHVKGDWLKTKFASVFTSLQSMDTDKLFKSLTKMTHQLSETQKTVGQIQTTIANGPLERSRHLTEYHKARADERERTVQDIKDNWRGLENFVYEFLRMEHETIRQLYNR